MSLIVLKLPRSRRRVKYIRSEELIEKDKREREIRLKPLLEPEPEPEIIEEQIEEIPEQLPEPEAIEEAKPAFPKRTVYSEEFTILDSAQPIEISLKNIPEDSVSLEEFQKEIQSAYDKGFKDGADSSSVTMQTEILKHFEYVRNIDIVTEELRSEYHKAIQNFEESLISLAMVVSEHILQHEITLNSEIVIEQTRKAISSLDEETIFKIHVNPENYHILKEAKSRLTADSSKTEGILVVSNKSVDPGGCMLETSAGLVDARIKTQLDKLEQNLRTALLESKIEQHATKNSDVEDDNA